MQHHDVIILGGGLVGLTLALALDTHGVATLVVDPADPETQLSAGFDGRASAISSASHRMLEAIGVAPRIADQGCAIRGIRVADGLKPGKLDFTPAPDDDPLGIMYENRVLRGALHAAASEADHVTLAFQRRAARVDRAVTGVTMTLDDGSEHAAGLLVAADGRQSPTREASGIKVARWRYDHVAIVTMIAHALPHDSIAYELFYPAGPFAILPMRDSEDGRHRSAIVWSVRTADAPGYLKLGERGFAAELEARMGGFLGAVTLIAPRASYPLGFHHTVRITEPRLALIGDAAHGIHPIAGQGLNLGLRDAAALAEVVVEGLRLGLEPGDPALLERYERWRAVDSLSVAVATDTLTRLFGIPGETASAIRRVGIAAVDRLAPLKDRLMAEARGEAGTLPKLLQGLAV